MSQVKATFYLPLRDNDGADLSAARDEVFRELHRLFGQWTVAGTVRGAYRRGDGETDVDDSVACVIVVDAGRVGDVERVLRDFKAATKQESIYLELVRGVEVRLL